MICALVNEVQSCALPIYAGIAAGRRDDGPAGLEFAGALGILDHREGDAVLDRSAGIGALRLDPDLGGSEQAVDADVRRVADRLQDVRCSHVLSSFSNIVSGGSNVRARLISGHQRAQRRVTRIAPAPPATTAATGPLSAARNPDSASPSSFAAEMVSNDTDATRANTHRVGTK